MIRRVIFLTVFLGLLIATFDTFHVVSSIKSHPSSTSIFSEKYRDDHPHPHSNLRLTTAIWKDFDNIRISNGEEYSLEESLGAGGFAEVFKGKHLLTGDQVALRFNFNPRGNKQLQREFKILEDLRGAPNFLPLRDIFKLEKDNKEAIVPVFDCFEKEHYKNLILKLTKYKIKHFMYQLLRTLKYAHSKGIIHRDIKPQNVLMNTRTLQVRVIDWGTSEYYSPKIKRATMVGTRPFKAVETLLDFPYYGTAFDIWSTGCMLAEMAFLKRDFFKTQRVREDESKLTLEEKEVLRHRELLDDIAKVLGTEDLIKYTNRFKNWMNLDILNYVGNYEKVPFEKFINEKNAHLVDSLLIDLLESMLVYDHTRRITAAEALEHPYFDDVRQAIGILNREYELSK